MQQVHIRYAGNSYDLTFEELDVGINSTDEAVKHSLANYLNISTLKLNDFIIDRNTITEDITVCPNAQFGTTQEATSPKS